MGKNNTNRRTKKKKRGIPAAVTVLISLFIALLVFIGCTAAYVVFFHKPALSGTAPDMELAFDSNFYIWRKENYSRSYHWTTVFAPGRKHVGMSDTVINDPAIQQNPGTTVEPVEKGPIRNTNRVNFLVMGHDKVALNTDVIMLVNFDMEKGGLSILQIPRDTFFKTGRINTLMANERAEARRSDSSLKSDELIKAGMAGAVEELEKSLGIRIDGYALVNLEGFRNIIDAIGGVYVDVPYAMHYEDPEQNLYIHLNAGGKVLNGKQAEMFVRFRKGYVQGDIGRVNAQKIFLTALFKELKDIQLGEIPEVAENVIEYVTTDVGLTDVIYYAKELLGVDMGNVSMVTLPGSDTRSSSGASYYVMNRAAVLPIINGYFNVFDNYSITDSVFDKDRSFTANDRRFSAIYDATDIESDIKIADDIDEESLDVPLIQ